MPKDANKPGAVYRLQRHCISFVTASFSGPQHAAGGVPVAFMYCAQGTSFSAHDGVWASASLGATAVIATAAAKINAAGNLEKPIPGLFCASLSLYACVCVFLFLSLSLSNMVSTHLEPLVSDIKLSSVVPSIPTGDNKIHELTNIDLAMKLHYIKGLYFFNQNSVQGIGISDMKKPMFQLLDRYAAASGRIRRSENGRPFVNCNDSGVRIVEADCSKITLEEWMKGMKDGWEINEQLFYPHALGPDLGFAPLVFVQFTWFKCGGLSVGLSWAHVLGDPFAASTFINTWAHIMAGQMPPQPLKLPNSTNTGECQFPPNSNSEKPFSLKRVDPVDDYWLVSSSCQMETLSFHFTARKLDQIASKASGLTQYFHLLAALMWKSLAKIRGESEPRVVTICNSDPRNKGIEGLSNGQVIGTVEADFKVAEADLSELAKLIEEKMVDERSLIDEWVGRENGKSDFILYGSNLTFVNLEGAEIYGLRIKGQKPVFASYGVGGAGDEGVVLVLPAPANSKGGDCGDGRVVTAILPKDQNIQLKKELRNDWGVF